MLFTVIVCARQVDELQKLSASLKMELELKIVEEIESMQVSLENVEERFAFSSTALVQRLAIDTSVFLFGLGRVCWKMTV